MLEGVDYGSVDGNSPPDFAAARTGGLSFVIIRGAYTYNRNVVPDSHLARDRVAAQRAGLRVGSYLILSYDPNGPTPEAQAQAFIRVYGQRRDGELPVSLDAETNSADHLWRSCARRLAWIERAYDELHAFYGIVMTYTSENQWSENFGDANSRLGEGLLWCKVPYPWKEHNPSHPESCPPILALPRPWRRPSSPGVWIEQYQGDAVRVPGFSTTVDCNRFLPYVDGHPDARSPWVRDQLAAAHVSSVAELQRIHKRAADSIVGPSTFCDLAR